MKEDEGGGREGGGRGGWRRKLTKQKSNGYKTTGNHKNMNVVEAFETIHQNNVLIKKMIFECCRKIFAMIKKTPKFFYGNKNTNWPPSSAIPF